MRKRTWTDEQLIEAVGKSYSMSGVIRELGLKSYGGNMKNIKPHIKRLDLDTSHWHDPNITIRVNENKIIRFKDKEILKWCNRCKEYKVIQDFTKIGRPTGDGYAGYCKSCMRNYKWTLDLKKKYNLTPEEYYSILENQENKCAICGQGSDRNRWDRFYVDHCHDTQKVRGLLCSSCNLAIGMFKHNSKLLKKAAKYLGEDEG